MQLRALFLLVLGLALLGCGEEASPEPEASASARPGSQVKAIDQAGYCSRICQRATACGLESAESLARATPGEVALIGKLKSESSATEQACVAECRKDALGEGDAKALAEAERCIEQTTCDVFSRCLGGSASADHP